MADSDSIRFGYIGRAVAGIIIGGIPTLIGVVTVAAVRNEHRVTITEQRLAIAEERLTAVQEMARRQEERIRVLEDWKRWMDQREQRRRAGR